MSDDERMDGFRGFGGHKGTKRSKDDAIYGVFNEEKQQEDPEAKRKRSKQLNKPMSFTPATASAPAEKLDTREDDFNQGRAGLGDGGLGLGASAAMQGIGASAGLGMSMSAGLGASAGLGLGAGGAGLAPGFGNDDAEPEEEEEDDEVRSMMPQGFINKQDRRQRRLREEAVERKKRSIESKAAVDPQMKEMTKKIDPEQLQRLQTLEQGSKGIGFKLLMKMGFKGTLGASGSKGLARPIEVQVRKQGMGLQESGERTQQQKEDFPTDAEKEERVKEEARAKAKPKPKAAPTTAWKKSANAGPKKKKKIVYKTVAELTADEREAAGLAQPQLVVDMRGPQKRVVTDMGELSEMPDDPQMESEFAEMRYNTRLLLDLAEVEIHDTDRRLKGEKQTLKAQEQTQGRLEAAVAAEAEAAERLRSVLSLVDEMQALAKKGGDVENVLQSTGDKFEQIMTRYRNESLIHGLNRLAAPVLLPVLRKMFGAAWQPLEDPLRGVDQLARWQRLLTGQGGGMSSRGLILGTGQDEDVGQYGDLFSSCINEALMTRLRRCITNEWDCVKPGPMVQLLEAWQPLVCDELLENILDQLVMPKLQREVDSWSPRTAIVPIHHWLHPWLPVAGQRITRFTPTIKQKLSNALSAWQPQDPSAHVVLAPWHGIFDDKVWRQLMLDNIIPPLVKGLRGVALDPTAAEGAGDAYGPFLWVQRWQALLPPGVYATLIEQELLYKWLVALRTWISPAGGAAPPDLGAVMAWYEGWKSVLGAQVQADPAVQKMLNQALEMFNELLEEGGQVSPPAKPYPPRFDEQGRYSFALGADPVSTAPSSGSGAVGEENPQKITYKHVIERFAAECDAVFMPTQRMRGDGSRVYQFGSASIAIDVKENLVWMQDSGGGSSAGWNLVDLDGLKKAAM